MKKAEKIKAIQAILDCKHREDIYYKLLADIGAVKPNYYDCMTTEPINCDVELKRVAEADFDLCAELLTMMLREDHFMNGSLTARCEFGPIDTVLRRMIEVLSL